MSYYDEINDPNRTSSSQYPRYVLGATSSEQSAASVHHSDGYCTADSKIQQHRISCGLDPYTGAYVPKNTYYGGEPGSHHVGEPSALGMAIRNRFWGLFKWLLLYPALVVIFLLVALIGAAYAGQTLEGATISAKVFTLFEGYQPKPVSAWLDPKVAAVPVSAKELVRGLRGRLEIGARSDQRFPTFAALKPKALACLAQEPCRETLRTLAPDVYSMIPNLAASLLIVRGMKGDESAALDACLLPLRFGTGSLDDLRSARETCKAMSKLNPRSKAAQDAMDKIERSWAALRGSAYLILSGPPPPMLLFLS